MTAPSLPSLGARGAALIRADLLRARCSASSEASSPTRSAPPSSTCSKRSPPRSPPGSARLRPPLRAARRRGRAVRRAARRRRLAEPPPRPPPGDRDAVQPQGPAVRRRRAGRLAAGPGRRDLAALQAIFALDAPRLARAAAHAANAEPSDAWVPWDRFQPLADGAGSSPRPASPSRSGSPPRTTGRRWPRPSPSTTPASARRPVRAVPRVPLGARGRPARPPRRRRRPRPDPPRPARRLRPRARPRPPEHRAVPGRLPRQQRAALRRPRHRKSSTVKALLNEHAGRGLRLVEVSRDDLGDFPDHPAARDRPERFILFVDDLSFDEGERDYRLWAVLEGSVEARPSNVVLYATSNRRHLVQERWTDRESTLSAEVHGQDAGEALALRSVRHRVVFAGTSGATWRSSSRWRPSAASPSIPRCCADGRSSGPSGTTAGAGAPRASSSITWKASWGWPRAPPPDGGATGGRRPRRGSRPL